MRLTGSDLPFTVQPPSEKFGIRYVQAHLTSMPDRFKLIGQYCNSITRDLNPINLGNLLQVLSDRKIWLRV